MLICAIDTSGREGSLALASDDAGFEVLQFASLAGGTYSANLIPQLDAALLAAGRKTSDINLLVVASGPGSFTGLRVGIATVKALAEVLAVPVVAISVLEAIAYVSGQAGTVVAALDAQRNEVFAGEYVVTRTPGKFEFVSEALVSANDFSVWLGAHAAGPVTVSPDESVLKIVESAGARGLKVVRPNAAVYARIGLEKLAAGITAEVESLDANYVRRSDAEIFSAPKLGIKSK